MVEIHLTGYEEDGTKTTSTVMPGGTKVVSAESWSMSAWTETAKVSLILPDGSPKGYFLKVNILSSS